MLVNLLEYFFISHLSRNIFLNLIKHDVDVSLLSSTIDKFSFDL